MLLDARIEPWMVHRYTSNELHALTVELDARAKAAGGGDA